LDGRSAVTWLHSARVRSRAWQIQSYFRYQLPWESCSIKWDLIAGYRLLHFDRKPGNRVEADYTFRGPVLGFGARF
jgi:hypothetical protein